MNPLQDFDKKEENVDCIIIDDDNDSNNNNNDNNKQEQVVYYKNVVVKKSTRKKRNTSKRKYYSDNDKKNENYNLDLLKLIVNDAVESKLNMNNINNIKKILDDSVDNTKNTNDTCDTKINTTTTESLLANTQLPCIINNKSTLLQNDNTNNNVNNNTNINNNVNYNSNINNVNNVNNDSNNNKSVNKILIPTFKNSNILANKDNIIGANTKVVEKSKNQFIKKEFEEAGFYSYDWPKNPNNNKFVDEIYVTIVNGGGGGGGALMVKNDNRYLMGGGGGAGSSGSAVINYCIRLSDLGYDYYSYDNEKITLEIKVGEGGKGGKSKIISKYEIDKFVFEEAEKGQSGKFSFILIKYLNFVKKLGFFQKENLNFENGGGGAQLIIGLNLSSTNENTKYDGNYIKGGKGGYFNWFFKNGRYEYEDYYLYYIKTLSQSSSFLAKDVVKINNDYFKNTSDENLYNFNSKLYYEPYERMIKFVHTSLRFSNRVITYQLNYNNKETNNDENDNVFIHPLTQQNNNNNSKSNNAKLTSILNNSKSVNTTNNQLYSIEMMPRTITSVKKQNIKPICYFDDKKKRVWNIDQKYGLSVELSSLCGQGGGCAIGKFIVSDSNSNNYAFALESLYNDGIYILLNNYQKEYFNNDDDNNSKIENLKIVNDNNYNLNLSNENIENIIKTNKMSTEYLDTNTLEYDMKKRWEHGELFSYNIEEKKNLYENNYKWISGGSAEPLIICDESGTIRCASGGNGASIYHKSKNSIHDNDLIEDGKNGMCGFVQIKYKI